MNNPEHYSGQCALYQPSRASLWVGFVYTLLLTSLLALATLVFAYYYFVEATPKSGLWLILIMMAASAYTIYNFTRMTIMSFTWAKRGYKTNNNPFEQGTNREQ